MAHTERRSLREIISSDASPRFCCDRDTQISIERLAGATCLGGRVEELTGRSVLLATGKQLTTALALIELDGIARRIVILPPDVASEHVAALIDRASVDAIVTDRSSAVSGDELPGGIHVIAAADLAPIAARPIGRASTEWLLLTSGTTGVPKLVVHSLAGLTAPMNAGGAIGDGVVWGTFYDIRRYGGLQIFFRGIAGNGSLILSEANEPITEHLARLARHGVTHLSGTPSHWRRALMSASIEQIAPRYIRLSGEIADQAILDRLMAVFPNARVGHAYASTEAGVAFEVNDGLAGFPAAFVAEFRAGVEMKVVEDSLRIRSPRTAQRYFNSDHGALLDEEGFVDTGDLVELRGDRYFFIGRRGGIINVGGLKVHPEEIEAVINRHPHVEVSLVRSKQSPVTGAIVIADVVLVKDAMPASDRTAAVKNDILDFCRAALPRHKVPAAISVVPSLAVAATGKLARHRG